MQLVRIPTFIAAVLLGGIALSVMTAPFLPAVGTISYGSIAPGSSYEYIHIRDIGRSIDMQLMPYPLAQSGTSWSPDGNRVLYVAITRQGQYLEIYDVRRGDFTPLLQHVDGIEWGSHDWSPAGDCIAFILDRAIYTYCFADDTLTLMTRDGVNQSVTWAPDSEHLLYASNRDGLTDLYTMNVATGDEVQLTTSGVAKFSPDFMPDGRRIVYGTFFRDMGQIMSLNTDTMDLEQLTESGRGFAPAVSADGRYMVYMAQASGTNWNVYLRDMSTGQIQAVTSQSGSELSPAWVPLR